ncbi:MAG: hypothetical protein P4K98_13015 [Bryobacteraceae bacterium]|nr:hypothetical protein [Bryobacteraceae bacterium]
MSTQAADRRIAQPALTAGRERLLDVLDRLQRPGELTGGQRLALSEAEFRLAALPGASPSEAIARMGHAIALDPLHPKLHYHLGLLRHRAGDLYGAVCAYRQALQLAPGSKRALAHMALAMTAMQGKPKKLGRDFLDALWAGSGVDSALKKVESWIRNESTAGNAADENKRSNGDKGAEAESRHNDVESEPSHSLEGRWHGLSRIYLLDLLCRPKVSDTQLRGCLDAVGKCPGEAAQAARAVFALLPPLADGISESGVNGSDGALRGMAQALLGLQRENDGKRFVELAARAAVDGAAPDEWLCVLHYRRFGPDGPLPRKDALELLTFYPADIAARPAFRELRIAVLDEYARRAYSEESYAPARILWREAYSIDPRRTALAHNLALCGARMRSMEDYASAWPRAVELRYMEAAAARDISLGEDERARVHQAVASQACASYMPQEHGSAKDLDYPKWAADRVAVKTWLSEWDLYYVNARLAFRSPVHRLAIARDATPEAQALAKQSLLTLIEIGSRRFPAGARRAATALARESVEQADRLAALNIERARDRYYALEAKAAEKLQVECVQRVCHIVGLLKAHEEDLPSTDMVVSGWLGIRLLALPLEILAPLLARAFSGLEECEIRGCLEQLALAAVARDSRPRRGDEPIRDGLEVLDWLFRLMPSKQEEARALKRRFGVEMLPEDCQRVKTAGEAARAVECGLKLLRRYPHADGLRWHLAELMTQMGRRDLLDQADELVREGRQRGVSPEFVEVFEQAAEKSRKAGQELDVSEEVKRLLDQAAEAARSAVSAVKAGGYDALERAFSFLDDAHTKAREARAMAEGAEMEAGVAAANNLEEQILALRERIRRG